ncbi:SAM-dependent methyltransferase [Parasalinivibrio latis]|uniref:methyltransferase n=1 Tax=Parasalinivibrio latis TaxID=2952610 RepID=UPI0030E4AE5B
MPGFQTSFSSLDSLLSALRQYWQFMPYAEQALPWEETNPALCEWLNQQRLPQLEKWKADTNALAEAVSEFIPAVKSLQALCSLEATEKHEQLLPSHLDTGIPGRKWQQIVAFNDSLPGSDNITWLEWCAGKGYLGRVISASRHQPVVSLEWQQTLCHDGQQFAEKHKLPMTFVHGDAFTPEAAALITSSQHAVALHACGDLHVTLLKHAAQKKTRAVSVSPCCFHLIRDKSYQPLSHVAKKSTLTLSKHDLKLPLQQTVTASTGVQKKRFTEVSFRLGFDALQKHLNGTNDYLPVPNCQKALLNEGFELFCQWAAETKGITLPENTDFGHWQNEGEKRFEDVERMETLRDLFRRPLEMWLVLDRACFLEEAGYSVTLSEFCRRDLTPRNILIQGRRD